MPGRGCSRQEHEGQCPSGRPRTSKGHDRAGISGLGPGPWCKVLIQVSRWLRLGLKAAEPSGNGPSLPS